ncbi:MAG: hypothetical protein ACI4TX_02995 [Christensenellales bacterium]
MNNNKVSKTKKVDLGKSDFSKDDIDKFISNIQSSFANFGGFDGIKKYNNKYQIFKFYNEINQKLKKITNSEAVDLINKEVGEQISIIKEIALNYRKSIKNMFYVLDEANKFISKHRSDINSAYGSHLLYYRACWHKRRLVSFKSDEELDYKQNSTYYNTVFNQLSSAVLQWKFDCGRYFIVGACVMFLLSLALLIPILLGDNSQIDGKVLMENINSIDKSVNAYILLFAFLISVICFCVHNVLYLRDDDFKKCLINAVIYCLFAVAVLILFAVATVTPFFASVIHISFSIASIVSYIVLTPIVIVIVIVFYKYLPRLHHFLRDFW